MRLKLILLAGLVGLLVIGLLFWMRSNQLRLYVSEPFATNLQFSQGNDKNIRFFTGSGFASYDLTKHSSTLITRVFSLPKVSEVRWAKNGVLFQASGYSGSDELEPILSQLQLPLSYPYWWSLDFASNRLALVGDPALGAEVFDARWLVDESGYVYLEPIFEAEEEGFHFTLVLADNGKAPVKKGSVEALKILWASRTKIIYSSPVEIAQVDLNGGNKHSLLDKASQDATVSPDGTQLAYLQVKAGAASEEHPSASLIVTDIKDLQPRVILDDFSGGLGWKLNDLLIHGVSEEKPVTALYSSGKMKDIKLLGSKVGIVTIQALSEQTFLVSGPKSTGYLASLDKSATLGSPELKTPYLETEKTIYQPTFYIAYFPEKDQYSIYITASPYRLNQKKAYDFVRSKGYDPNQLEIRWYADDRVDPNS